MTDRKSDFFTSFQEAQKAYLKWKKRDPFVDIPPALLNSADIADYVRLTGMIYPFYKKDLSGATYSVRLKGLCVYYKERTEEDVPEEHIFCIGKDMEDLPNAKNNCEKHYEIKDKLVLEPNSIAFITLEPVFQVPDYLALRFNLRIPHVYKGLLLGTGPIIDPGFQGRLSIPLHNLTSNRYTLSENDVIISLEITKMSPYSDWMYRKHCGHRREGKYIYTSITSHRQVTEYLRNALGQRINDGVISSVIAATNDIRKTANQADKEAKDAIDISNNTDRKINKWGIIGTIIAIFAIFITAVSFVFPVYDLFDSIKDTQAEYEIRIHELEEEISELNMLLEEMRSKNGQDEILHEDDQTEVLMEYSERMIFDEN